MPPHGNERSVRVHGQSNPELGAGKCCVEFVDLRAEFGQRIGPVGRRLNGDRDPQFLFRDLQASPAIPALIASESKCHGVVNVQTYIMRQYGLVRGFGAIP